MGEQTLLRDGLVATTAGFLATKVMERISSGLYALASEETRQQEEAVRPGPPYRIAVEKTAGLLGVKFDEDTIGRLATAVHYGTGISAPPLYMLLRRRTDLHPLAAGLASGAAQSLVVDEGLTALLGFSAPNRSYPAAAHLRGIAAHLALGVALAVLVEAGWRLTDNRHG